MDFERDILIREEWEWEWEWEWEREWNENEKKEAIVLKMVEVALCKMFNEYVRINNGSAKKKR